MSPFLIALVWAVASYLLGSISNARIIARLKYPGTDLSQVYIQREGGEPFRLKTVGATTASVKFGGKIGFLIICLDMIKGGLPVLIARIIFPDQYYHLIAAVFVTVGHNWPIYYRFNGGGGLSTTLAGFFIVDWIGLLTSVLCGFLVGLYVLRMVAFAFMLGPWFMLLWLIIFKGEWPYIAYGVIMNLLLSVAVLPDMREYFQRMSRLKKAGKRVDVTTHLDMFPMYRWMSRFVRRKEKQPDQQ
jgi:glycerol-3-phosphate acyltransferase PlsY